MCVFVSIGKSICIFLVLFLVTEGKGCNLLMPIVNLNEFITCHGKEMPVQGVGKHFLFLMILTGTLYRK